MKTVGHSCSIAEVQKILGEIKLKIVANTSSEQQAANVAPLVNKDLQQPAPKQKDPAQGSKKKSRLMHLCRPRAADLKHCKVASVRRTPVRTAEVMGNVTQVYCNTGKDDGWITDRQADLIQLWDKQPHIEDPDQT